MDTINIYCSGIADLDSLKNDIYNIITSYKEQKYSTIIKELFKIFDELKEI